MVDGQQIDRKYADYLITASSSKYVNNNQDAWERKLLLACFRTFVGGENYVEHIQIPELSKGKIIDAAARDIGDSIYVDILVATDKKHKALVEAISSKRLGTLSMGCNVAFTICSRCGNVAEDETQLCSHIKYQKGNYFLDDLGVKRKIAELCGHVQAEPGSVKFIEASWVENPAFTGAVLRSILGGSDDIIDGIPQRLQVAFSAPVRVSDPNLFSKAAVFSPVGIAARPKSGDHLVAGSEGVPSIGVLRAPKPYSAAAKAKQGHARRLREIESQDFGFDDGAPAKAPEEKKPEAGPLDKVKKDLRDTLVEEVARSVRDDIGKGEGQKVRKILDENSENESLIKSAWVDVAWRARAASLCPGDEPRGKKMVAGLVLYKAGGWGRVGRSRMFSGQDILALSRIVDRLAKKSSIAGEARLSRVVVEVGGFSRHSSEGAYLAACRKVMGRDLTEPEKIQLIFKGQLFSLGRLISLSSLLDQGKVSSCASALPGIGTRSPNRPAVADRRWLIPTQ